jgi:hypothetical protein
MNEKESELKSLAAELQATDSKERENRKKVMSRRWFIRALAGAVGAIGGATLMTSTAEAAGCGEEADTCNLNVCHSNNTCRPNTCQTSNLCVNNNTCSQRNTCQSTNNCSTSNDCRSNNTCNYDYCDVDDCYTRNRCNIQNHCTTDDQCTFLLNSCMQEDQDCGYFDF